MGKHFKRLEEAQRYLTNDYPPGHKIFKKMRGSAVTINPQYPHDNLVKIFVRNRRTKQHVLEARFRTHRGYVKPSDQRHHDRTKGEKKWRQTESRLKQEGKLNDQK